MTPDVSSAPSASASALDLAIVPANEASWDDLKAVLGAMRCHAAPCFCQRFKIPGREWNAVSDEERAYRLREQTECGNPGSDTTSGLVAYLDGEPVGWCAVEPRVSAKLLNTRAPWSGRKEDPTDAGVWAVTCFAVRAGFRRRGITYALARAAVDFARSRGARTLEGYSMITQPGKDVSWGEVHVGSRSVFEAAGFVEIGRPSLRRAVMRIEL